MAREDYVPGLWMPGEGTPKPFCGTAESVIACPTGERGPSAQARLPGAPDHTVAFRPHTCDRMSCPTCGGAAMLRASLRSKEILEATAGLLALERAPRHFVLSPPQRDAKRRLKEDPRGGLVYLTGQARRRALSAGLTGGLFVPHMWRCSGRGADRYRTSCRHLGPHFHFLAWGAAMDTRRFRAKFPGWILKNLDDPGRGSHHHNGRRSRPHRDGGNWSAKVLGTLLYLLDHATFHQEGDGKATDVVRYFGLVYRTRKLSEEVTERPIVCPCGAPCWEYEPDESAGGLEPNWGCALSPAMERARLTTYTLRKGVPRPAGAPEFVTVGGFLEPIDRGKPPDLLTRIVASPPQAELGLGSDG